MGMEGKWRVVVKKETQHGRLNANSPLGEDGQTDKRLNGNVKWIVIPNRF